jgi:hypothetical protein
MNNECGTNSCRNKSEFRVFWPGNEPLGLCQPCNDRALGIASAMGFHLHSEPCVPDATEVEDEEF